ncbi:zf-DHHC domain-containing protein [Rhizoctonia solani AG-1 IA]|uniref:Palmitoyltransferase n=1 Tax=Thanatephorus cucumeris (strain AG1-IA) TaxID=983506 RepID=L8WP69_THACA|nr:zf-DHHC domain-containing protein [Rhizoctonia solani AG-1 IA]
MRIQLRHLTGGDVRAWHLAPLTKRWVLSNGHDAPVPFGLLRTPTMADRPRGDWDCAEVVRTTYKEKQKEREESQKPQHWILQKLVVGVVLGIVVWTYYVYVGRVCIKLLERGDTVKAEPLQHVPQCEAPGTTQYGRPWDVDSEVRGTDDGHRTIGTAYEGMSERGHGQSPLSATSHDPTSAFSPDAQQGAALELDAIPPIASVHARVTSPVGDDCALGDASTTVHETQPYLQPVAAQNETKDKGRKQVHVTRNPPQTPVLADEYRYCARDKLMKPMRTHHFPERNLASMTSSNVNYSVLVGHLKVCSMLMLSISFVGIGQCVGAYNRKFFVNFTFWSTWFTAWVFGTLLADLIVDSRNISYQLDGQEIAVIALAGLFTMFTASLTAGHTRLLIINATTVESLGFSRTKEKDKANLEMAFKKHQTRKRWDQEWGRVEREGNLWWLENARTNWEQVMGHKVYEWFRESNLHIIIGPISWYVLVPIGKSPNNGMNYPVNPRHDPDGRWRPRSQWPVELQ